MKFSITLIALIFFCSSCSHLPGHYLTKRDPGFYTGKKDGNVSLMYETSGNTNGGSFNSGIALTDHFFVGIQGNLYSKRATLPPSDGSYSGASLYNMKGYCFRPTLGYFLNFGKTKKLYWEVFGGGGYQRNLYNVFNPYTDILYSERSNVLQLYGGTFFGWRVKRVEMGIDFSYERNWFRQPAMIYTFSDGFEGGDAYFDFIRVNWSRNINSSFYCAFVIRPKLNIILNAGWNAGYTEGFIRFGLRYKFLNR